MKKLLLSALFSVLFMGGTYAQFNFTSNTNIGQVLRSVNAFDKDTLEVNFNTAIVPSLWIFTTTPATPTVQFKNCQTQKGLQALAYQNATTTSTYAFGTYDCRDYGAQRNPIHVTSVDSLQKMLLKSVYASTKTAPGATTTFGTGGNQNDSVCRPAACLFDQASNDQAFGMYPGRAKRIEYGFQFNFSGKIVDNIIFDIDTYNAGTTGKTATYSLIVATGSATNVVYTNPTFYTTGSGVKSFNLLTETGLTVTSFTNQKVYILVKTLGTSNSIGVVDGMVHDTIPGLGTRQPVAIDPTVVFDDFIATYSSPYFTVPINVASNSNYMNYNNGFPAIKVADAGMTNLGTAVPITTGVSTPVTITLKSTNRVGTFTVMESFAHNANVTYALATAFKANDGSGNYSVPVACTETINGTTSMWTLTIAAPTAGTSVVDDMQFTYNVNKATDGNTQLRLEISNGSARFWYDFLFTASSTTALDGKSISPLGISTSNTMISVINATQDISIYTLSGQKVALLTANNAMNGVAVIAGAYIIKHGSDIRKVIVK